MTTESAGGANDDRGACTPCRGSGSVISSLGGKPHEITCPWCGGDGRFHRGRDAQQAAGETGRSVHERGPT
jgi:DnaJ-class molecular chaperone